MQMKPVTSSNIKAAGFENGVLRVQFTNGAQYDYKEVPVEVFNAFMAAKSQGKFYHAEIKSKFTGSKVVKEDDNG